MKKLLLGALSDVRIMLAKALAGKSTLAVNLKLDDDGIVLLGKRPILINFVSARSHKPIQ